MRKLTLILFSAILAVTFCASLVYAGGMMKKRVTCEGGERLTISLYNGKECETARVVIQTSGTTEYAYTEMEVQWNDDMTSGHFRKETFPIHPEERYTHEQYICMDSDNPEPGTGILKVVCGYDEVLYLEFSCDKRGYIRFHRR